MSLVGILTAACLCLGVGREEVVAIEENSADAIIVADPAISMAEGELFIDDGCDGEWCDDCCVESCGPRFSLRGMIARVRGIMVPSIRCHLSLRFHACESCSSCEACDCHPVFRLPRLHGCKSHRIPCDAIDMSDREVDGIPTNDWPAESVPVVESEPCTNCGGYVKPMPARVRLSTESSPVPEAPAPKKSLPTEGPDNGVRVTPADDNLSPVPTEGASVTTSPITPVGLEEVDQATAEGEDDPSWGHGEGHTWLVGKIEYLHLGGGAWVLRYLPYDQTDEFGGSIVLAHDSRLDQFNDGDVVKVLGEVVRKESGVYRGRALYRVRGVQLVEPMRVER